MSVTILGGADQRLSESSEKYDGCRMVSSKQLHEGELLLSSEVYTTGLSGFFGITPAFIELTLPEIKSTNDCIA